MTLFERLFIVPIRIDYELDETAAEKKLGPEAMAELRSRSAWGIQPDRSNKYRRQIEKVHDEKVNFIIKNLIVNGSPTNISFRNGIAYCGGMVSHIVVDPSNPWSFPTIQQLNNHKVFQVFTNLTIRSYSVLFIKDKSADTYLINAIQP